MALQSSGAISLNDIHIEGYYPNTMGPYGQGSVVSGTPVNINEGAIRSITDNYTSQSQINFGDFYGDQFANYRFGRTNVRVGKRIQSYTVSGVVTNYEIVTMYANDNISVGGGMNEYNNHLPQYHGSGGSQGVDAIFPSSNYPSAFTNEISVFRCGNGLFADPRETLVKIQSRDSSSSKNNPSFTVTLLGHSASNTWVWNIGPTGGGGYINISPTYGNFTYAGNTWTLQNSAGTNTNLGLGSPPTNVTEWQWLLTTVVGGGAGLWGHGSGSTNTQYSWTIT